MSTAQAFGGVKSGAKYDTDSWGTPRRIFDDLDQYFHFSIDLAADNENAKCERWYTKEDDALSKCWAGQRGFLNPPFSLITPFMLKSYDAAGYTDPGPGFTAMICKADTSTDWFHKLWDWHEDPDEDVTITFLKRIQFDPPKGYISKSGSTKPTSPNSGHLVAFFGAHVCGLTREVRSYKAHKLLNLASK